MVRTYKRTNKSIRHGKYHRPYGSYSDEALQEAISSVQKKELTLTAASERYGVPIATISRKSRGQNCSQPKSGHPTLFSNIEEEIFIKYAQVVSEWGFPIDTLDLRVLAHLYLSKIGRNIPTLRNNTPGRDWAINFMHRHKSQLSFRHASNISSVRAEINQDTLEHFFNNFETVCNGISPDRIINYDETNLSDDPGSKKFICKRGKKYPERVMDSTKSAISIMFAGTADGTLLNPYVVYKAEHLWDSWLNGGPPGTRYNRARSGWFDSVCFEDWFETVIIPYAKKKEGIKILLGDNLSSHFSSKVLESCQNYNIKFICLPAKATHILQPLDVAFYAPLKKYWRQILTDWKQKQNGRVKSMTKEVFPQLFSLLYQKLTANDTGKQNIISGFKKCGLYPLNRSRPIDRLPKKSQDPEHVEKDISISVIDMLSELRIPQQLESTKKRKKRVNVSPGKSVCVEDYDRKENSTNKKKVTKGKGKGKGKKSISQENNKNAENVPLVPPDVESKYSSSLKNEEENFLKVDLNKNKEPIIEHINQDITHFEPQPSTSSGQINRKRAQKRFRSASSISSNSSVEMSCHSDSDLIECSPELNNSDATLQLDDSFDEVFEETVKATIAINDDVLIRNHCDDNIQYHIARIESIEEHYYTVDMYQIRKIKQGLRFVKGKKSRNTTVLKNMVMKPVQLIETENNVFLLLNSTDSVYFT